MHPRPAPNHRLAIRCGAALLFTLAASVAGPATRAAHAQVGEQPARVGETVRVEGRVLSAATGQPLGLATVEIPGLGRSTVTDADGRFRFDRVPVGEHELSVGLLGYGETTRLIVAGTDPVEVRLSEDAVLLEGLTVAADRFEYRIRSLAVSSRVMDKWELYSGGGADAADVVLARGGVSEARCPNLMLNGCVFVRGEAVMPRVYINDLPTTGGLDALRGVPVTDIARVELIGRGTSIRVYTDWFMEWAARSNYRPLALGFN